MAEPMILVQGLVATAALLLSAGSTAQALNDPTRPPLEMMSAASVAGAAPRTPLQSILLSSVRKGAIINGQYVPLGGNYGKASLVRVTATEVTLKSEQGLEVLQLYAPMEKTPGAAGAEAKPEKMVRRP